ncbi:hypothetical protein PRZ48_006735 [Zasmidium cellare]|uniref:Uncharacterized protein n=1 Tax=Zasmidium cellare TaxID=395010 RepID=A0ABR0EP74_ZASCE|nr:hypothetical protein PRZ48_006735 [Zasmidium cellare]
MESIKQGPFKQSSPDAASTIPILTHGTGANYVKESAQQVTSGASAEANKAVAKDSNAPLRTRASAAKDYVSDKAHEKKHDGKAESHYQRI